MDKTKIEWCDSTWNPVTGCLHGCEYCYANKIATRFGTLDKIVESAAEEGISLDGTYFSNPDYFSELNEPVRDENGKIEPYPTNFYPTFHRYRLDEPQKHKKPRTIFVCSMADLFGSWVPTKWIVEVLDACRAAPQHRYLFLTKNPSRYLELDELALLPHDNNFWYGSTAAYPETDQMAWSNAFHTFVSIEPMLGRFGRPCPGALHDIDWFIVGAETGNRLGKIIPEKGWVQEVVDYCKSSGKPIFMKDSLIPIVGEENMRREFPWEVSK